MINDEDAMLEHITVPRTPKGTPKGEALEAGCDCEKSWGRHASEPHNASNGEARASCETFRISAPMFRVTRIHLGLSSANRIFFRCRITIEQVDKK